MSLKTAKEKKRSFIYVTFPVTITASLERKDHGKEVLERKFLFFFIGIKGRQKNKQYIVEPDEKINQENRSKKKRFYEKTVYKYLKKKMTKRLERGLKK